VERAALERDEPLVDELRATVDEDCLLGADLLARAGIPDTSGSSA
jgi:hypothetical protein